MLKNYFKTAFRNLLRNKTYGLLNIAGLSVGITCAALIFLWVENELTFDHHFENRDYLYKIMENQTYDGKTYTFGATPGPLAPAMKTEIPGVKNTCRTDWGTRLLFSKGDKNIYEPGLYCDPSFFKMFHSDFIKGDPDKAFAQLYSVVITEKMAKKFFPDEDPLGKMLKVAGDQDYVITGVVKDYPPNTSITFSWLSPYEIYEKKNEWLQNWGSNGIQTYVELENGVNPDNINKRLFNYIQTKTSRAIARPFIFAMNDWRLHSGFEEGKQVGGRITYVKTFILIAWIILIIACINFMNLSTSRSEQRAREVGVRKVMGAGKGMLIAQFIGESLIMSFISVFVALGILYMVLSPFNSMVQKQLSVNITNPLHLLILISIGLICGLVAGSYPAFYLSAFNPVSVLKRLKTKGSASAVFIRKGLVIVQFSLSIILIICTIVIYQQIQHVKKRDLGYNKENLISMELQGKMNEHFPAIRQELIASGVVENAAVSNQPLLWIGNNGDSFTWPGKDPGKQILITNEWASPEYVSTLGMKIKSGRDFNADGVTDSSNIIINEAFADLLGKDDAVGKTVKFGGSDRQIIGVVKNFLFGDMYAPASPLALFCDPGSVHYMFVRLKPGVEKTSAMVTMESIFKRMNPGYPFEYTFYNDDFDEQFRSEMLVGQLSRLFAILAIFISCLGLFGLAAYTAERRTKEIGIRKVLGATISSIGLLLSRDFIKLVMIAAVIAFPIAWWAMNKWLQDFAYRISISWWVFAAAALAALVIALFTISFQAIRAAIANPVNSLKTE